MMEMIGYDRRLAKVQKNRNDRKDQDRNDLFTYETQKISKKKD